VAVASPQIVSRESLAEVVIAEEGKAACVIALFGVEAVADGGKGSGEGPAAEEGGNAIFRNREEEFVILAAGEGELGSGAGREGDLVWVDFKSDAGGAGEAREIGTESVAEVEHGGGELVADEPLAFGEAWGEGEMAAGPGATEFSRDEKKMSCAGTGAVWGVVFCYSAEEGDGDEELAGSDSFATDDGEAEFFGEKGESAVGLA
jgi:hypothetical protein